MVAAPKPMPNDRILLCLDNDPQPSVFDSIVALDGGAEHLLRHGNVQVEQVRELVYGTMFTRGGNALKNTAIFIGGSEVQAGERLLEAVQKTFFGSVRVSVMVDSKGANTTAAAAVLSARKHLPFGPETTALVLGGTGPVGQRVVRLLAQEGVEVRLASRRLAHAEGVCHRISQAISGARITPHSTADAEMTTILGGVGLLISAGAIGVEMLSQADRQAATSLQVAIDLNAVPPAGLAGIEPQDKGTKRDGQICYGALGVGGLKMKIHKAAIAGLFKTHDQVFDADEIYKLGKELDG